MEIYAAPKLSEYMTALGAYNVKSFIYEINQYTRARAHTHTHTHTRARTFLLKIKPSLVLSRFPGKCMTPEYGQMLNSWKEQSFWCSRIDFQRSENGHVSMETHEREVKGIL